LRLNRILSTTHLGSGYTFKTLLPHFYIIQDHQFYPEKFERSREHQGSQFQLQGSYYLLPSHHLGRESRAPGWVRLLRGTGQVDRVLLLRADPHTIERMEGHKALQATQAPESSAVLRRPRSLTTASSRSNFFILLRLETLVTNTMSACYGDWDSSLQPS
jgi:hypothetical protein